MTIEAHAENILRRQDEILAKVNELKNPVTVISPNINEMFIRGYYIKLRYVGGFIVIIIAWAVTASVSSIKYKEESFAHYSMYQSGKRKVSVLDRKNRSKTKEKYGITIRKR